MCEQEYMKKPQNPYEANGFYWNLFEGDWSDLTLREIAEVLGESKSFTQKAIVDIRKKTGYQVPFVREIRSEMTQAFQSELREIFRTAGEEEVLAQTCKECAELIQAVSKVRRAHCGTTPVALSDALSMLCEECADVSLLLDVLIANGLVDFGDWTRTYIKKLKRWERRLFQYDTQRGDQKPERAGAGPGIYDRPG